MYEQTHLGRNCTYSTSSYVGTLHEINPESATIALEDVYSYGTEDRKTGPEFIPASTQKFEYIVFRGSDVKDIKLQEEQKENRQPTPPNVPNDPAILVSGSRRRKLLNTAPFTLSCLHRCLISMMKYFGCKSQT